MQKKGDTEKVVGCIGVGACLCTTVPMWLVLLFALMSANDMPTCAWTLYWAYVPTYVLVILAMGIIRLLADG